MIKKNICFILVFICLFFVSISNVCAEESENIISIDFDSSDFNSYLTNNSYTDVETGIVYTYEDLLNILVDNFKDNYKFILIVTCSGTSECSVGIQQLDYSSTSATLKVGGDYLRMYPAGTVRFEQVASLWNGIRSEFTIESFLQKWQMYINNDAYNGSTNITITDFYIPRKNFPYFSNISYTWNDDNYIIDSTHSSKNYIIAKGDTMENFFYLSSSKNNSNFPVPSFELSNVKTNENNLVTSVDVTFDFKELPSENTTYMYSLNNGTDWNNLPIDTFTYTTTVNENTTLRARLLKETTFFNEKHLKIDFIGKDLDYYYSFLENKYNSDFEEELESLTLNSDSSVQDYLKYWYLQLKRTFPIVFQLSDIMNLFNSDKYNYNSNEIPDTTINLSFLGIDKNISIFNFDFYIQYKEQIFNIIKILASVYTFVAIQNIIREASKQT